METGKLLWITGLSGAGKTTIGSEVYDILKSKYLNTVFIDGDIIRETLGNDLGHDIEDRKRNAVRISKMCEFLTSQNINVVCATLSLFKEIHDLNRKNIKQLFFWAKSANPSKSSTFIGILFSVPPFPGAVKTVSTLSL